jgi:FixJ family two-component response regulator
MPNNNSKVYIVDDDDAVRDSLRWLVESVGLKVETFASANEFLDVCDSSFSGCLVSDVRMQGMSGLELQEQLNLKDIKLPIIFITGFGDIQMAVHAMQAGAVDFITKPFNDQELLDRIQHAIEKGEQAWEQQVHSNLIKSRYDLLTPREKEVMAKVVKGKLNKVIAADLNVSNKTVEAHRAKVMEKMQAANLAQLIRMATDAGLAN